MGGYGSGRKDWQLKTLVEDCFGLSVKTIKRYIADVDLKGGTYPGSVCWTLGGEKAAEISYRVNRKNGNLFVQLIYQTTNSRTRVVTKFDYPVKIQHTQPNYGGKRYWFTCPLQVGGELCQKRVGKLYLPPGGIYFGCRHCYDLVYLSSRESHRWDNMWWMMGVDPRLGKELEKRMKDGEWQREAI